MSDRIRIAEALRELAGRIEDSEMHCEVWIFAKAKPVHDDDGVVIDHVHLGDAILLRCDDAPDDLGFDKGEPFLKC